MANADNLRTVLEFVGDAASAQNVIAGLISSLKSAAKETQNIFTPLKDGLGDVLKPLTDGLGRVPTAAKPARDSILAHAQAVARLEVAEGDAAKAAETLRTAIANSEKGTTQSIRAQLQLVNVEAQLATAAGKAETAMLNEARAIARLQQIAGDTPGAIKTLGDALEKATNKASLPALRAELQKTYLDTNYANSPLIGAINRVNEGLGFLRPLLGGTGGSLQSFTGFLGQAAQSAQNYGQKIETSGKQSTAFADTVATIQRAISAFRSDEGGSASATDFFLNLSKQAANAGDRVRASMAGIRDSIAGAFSRPPQSLGLGTITGEANQASQALVKIGPAASTATEGLTGTTAAAGATTAAVAGVVAVVGALLLSLAAVVALTVSVASGLQTIGANGIKTNTDLETLKLGLTTVIASVAEIRNGDGIQLKGIDALNASLPVAGDQVRKLRIDALATSATIADIGPAFQAAIGPGLAAGLTIDEIRKNTINLTQAVTALGLPMDQIKQETRAILSGDINRNTQAAIALGITREGVKEAQKQGKFAEFLEDKLSAAAAAGKLVSQTFAAAQSNLKEAADTFQAVVTEGLFDQLRDKANAILPQIFDTKAANLISSNFEGIAETLTRVFDTAGRDINGLIDEIFQGVKDVSAFLDRNQDTVGEIIESVSQIVDLVFETVKGVAEIALGGGDAAEELDTVSSILIGTVRVVAFMGDLIKQQVAFWKAVGGAIVAFVLEPVRILLKALAFVGQIVPGIGKVLADASDTVSSIQKQAANAAVDGAKKLQTTIRDTGKAGEEAVRKIAAARARAASGQRAVEGVERKTPTAQPGTTFKPPKREDKEDKAGAAKARQEAAGLLKLLQNQEKTAELANRRITEGLRQSLTDRLISLETFTELSIRNDSELLEKRLASLKAEEAAAIRTAKTETDAAAKRAEFKLKAETLQQEADIKAEALQDDLRRTREKNEEDHQSRLIGIREAARKTIETAIKASVNSGITTDTDAERQLIELERERFAEREGRLNAALEAAREDVAQRQEIADQLELLAVERAAFEDETSQRIISAQKKEAEAFSSLLKKRIDGLVDLRRAQIEARAAQTVVDVQRGTVTKTGAAELEFQRRRELLQIETNDRQAAIEREALDLKRQAQNQAGAAALIVQIERTKNAQLKAEKDRAKAEDQALENQQRAVTLAPIFGQDVADRIASAEQILGSATSTLDQLRIAAQTTAEGLQESLPSIGQVFAQSALAITESTAAIIASFVAGQVPLRKAAAALFAAALAPLKNYLLKKSTAEFALALADLAIGNYPGAAKHTLAGVGLAAAAGLIDVGGSLIGGSGTGGGATGAAIGGGGKDSANQTISPRNLTQDTPKPEQTVIILRPEINLRGDIRRGVLEVVHDDINNNGPTRRLIQETAPTG